MKKCAVWKSRKSQNPHNRTRRASDAFCLRLAAYLMLFNGVALRMFYELILRFIEFCKRLVCMWISLRLTNRRETRQADR